MQYVHLYGTVIPIMLCNAVAGIYFLMRGAQAIISIITGKVATYVMATFSQFMHYEYLFIQLDIQFSVILSNYIRSYLPFTMHVWLEY